MNGCLLRYTIEGKAEERFIENTKEAVNTAEEIAKKGCNVYIYSIKDGVESEGYWFSATWEL